MSVFLRQIARYAARKLASDPKLREKAGEAARKAATEAGEIARSDDKARAAGRAVRRALDKLQGGR